MQQKRHTEMWQSETETFPVQRRKAIPKPKHGQAVARSHPATGVYRGWDCRAGIWHFIFPSILWKANLNSCSAWKSCSALHCNSCWSYGEKQLNAELRFRAQNKVPDIAEERVSQQWLGHRRGYSNIHLGQHLHPAGRILTTNALLLYWQRHFKVLGGSCLATGCVQGQKNFSPALSIPPLVFILAWVFLVFPLLS